MYKRSMIGNKIYDVISDDMYNSNENLYKDGNYAIEKNGIIYPIRKMSESGPGYYNPNILFGVYISPIGDLGEYSSDKALDFRKTSSMREMIEKTSALKEMEREILTSVDNVFIPPVDDSNDPEMKAFKQAVISKQIDIDKYEDRIGPSFGNDKRLFKKNSITLGKMKDLCNAMDIKVTLTFENKTDDVPNPMASPISVEITSTGGNANES